MVDAPSEGTVAPADPVAPGAVYAPLTEADADGTSVPPELLGRALFARATRRCSLRSLASRLLLVARHSVAAIGGTWALGATGATPAHSRLA